MDRLVLMVAASGMFLGACDREAASDVAPAGARSEEEREEAREDQRGDAVASAAPKTTTPPSPPPPASSAKPAGSSSPTSPARPAAPAPPTRGSSGGTSPPPVVEPPPMSRPEPAPTLLPEPPFEYTLARAVSLSRGPAPVLKRTAAARNGVVDVDAWFKAHRLRLPTFALPGGAEGSGTLPEHITTQYRGARIREAIEGDGVSIAVYSKGGTERDVAVVRDASGETRAALDFSRYAHGPDDAPGELRFTAQELQWAQVRDGVLFACHYHRTYASSSGGRNAFITALDLTSGELRWRSAPLVCNSRNFLLRDGWIITGYGFTAEPDFLYVLDARTGETVFTVKVASGPEVILESRGTLYVRTYDRDYEFALR